MARIFVAGAGGWGTALGLMTLRYGHEVTLWSPFEEEIAAIRRDQEHKKLLPGVPVPETMGLTTSLADAAGADLVILAVPSFAVEQTARGLAPVLDGRTVVANAGKGLQNDSLKRFSEVIGEAIPGCPVVALSGPSHAEEVARGIPTAVVSASADRVAAEKVQGWLMNPRFRVYVNPDIIGVELGGALKNVIALAAGILDGMRQGDNTKAALVTRGLAEMARLGAAMGAQADTFAGLSGLGDLMVTCNSMHSRNRRAGILIGQGFSAAEAVAQVGTVEGYLASEAAWRLGQRYKVELPIIEECYHICYQGLAAEEAVRRLMERPRRWEQDFSWT
ncbi:MAG: NAD(P)H-dependent glycerol-3-phosphate dehydrogenase [Acutalibacteraceae bacterium]|jgi:glycerol-3-phosphate dehydrogenase (NAD(P)+)